ncbi:MAG: hypothetical protein ACI8Z1_001264 [Candidatus Azotimanducaceae bacterium]|jgi:hypothetical protein
MSLTHPFDPESLYELMDDGSVRVSKDGKAGIFTGEGIHISGEIREADPQVCNWVNNVPNPDTQLSTNRIAGRDSGGVSSHLS